MKKTKTSISILNATCQVLAKKRLLNSNEKLLLAISGGQDSICLLFLLLHLKKQWNWNLSIIHCNHLWQKESFETAYQVCKIGFLFSTFLYLTSLEYSSFTEQKSRNWRFRIWERVGRFYNYNALITGHSASDRVETILFNLIRGSGMKGITSLQWKKLIHLNANKSFLARSEGLRFLCGVIQFNNNFQNTGWFVTLACFQNEASCLETEVSKTEIKTKQFQQIHLNCLTSLQNRGPSFQGTSAFPLAKVRVMKYTSSKPNRAASLLEAALNLGSTYSSSASPLNKKSETEAGKLEGIFPYPAVSQHSFSKIRIWGDCVVKDCHHVKVSKKFLSSKKFYFY